MRAQVALALLALIAAVAVVRACEDKDMGSFCRYNGETCYCGYMCKSDSTYSSRRACWNAFRESSSNKCLRTPCVMGICIQTTQDPGYICKCDGTGFYGLRCEKPCPTVQLRDSVFPHECVVI